MGKKASVGDKAGQVESRMMAANDLLIKVNAT